MEMIETVAVAVGRGKGIATNVPERELIEQVRIRPLIYDKTVKDYRKPGVSDSAWLEVATALNTSVTNCKKRWKSLRDTFIKYYRLDLQYSTVSMNKKAKYWNFYEHMLFLKHHVELFRLEDNVKDVASKNNKSESTDFYAEDEGDIKQVYEIKIVDGDYEDENSYRMKEDHLMESYEEQLENSIEEFELVEHEETDKETKTIDEQFYFEEDNENEEQAEETEESPIASVSHTDRLQSESELKPQDLAPPASSTAKNIVDPDERYLMSCLPAFKRFTPQQKAYVRMGIERLFYEVEFENISDPKSKKCRLN